MSSNFPVRVIQKSQLVFNTTVRIYSISVHLAPKFIDHSNVLDDILYDKKRKKRRQRRKTAKTAGRRRRRTIDSIIVFHRSQTSCCDRDRIPVCTPVPMSSSYLLRNNLNFMLWNSHSLDGKISALCASMMSNRTDTCLVSES